MGGGKVERMSKIWNQNISGNYFPIPNALFRLNLCPGEIAVYAYLMHCENRKNYQCHPSYKTIGEAIQMSPNTVRKYVSSLVDKRLIYTEPTSVITQKGEKRNGTLCYTIRNIQDALNYLHEQEWEQVELELAKMNLESVS